MGKHSKKTISSAGQGSEPERSGLGADRDNPEQRPLAAGEASGETPTSVDGICYEEMKDFYEAKIVVLEKQVAHWKEIAKR